MDAQPIPRGKLVRMVIVRVLGFLIVLPLMFFLPAGTWRYWQAWIYMAVLFIPMAFALAYLLKNDPALMERRMRMREKVTEQKRIIQVSYLFFLAAYLLPGFDIRYGWSHVPVSVVIVADGIVLTGYLIFFWVIRTNSYASRIIEVEQGQRVISTGPYAIVRHPMYLGVLILYVFSPLALGSYWAMIPTVITIFVVVARILNEEKVLSNELKGYDEYRQKVRYRLLPGIW